MKNKIVSACVVLLATVGATMQVSAQDEPTRAITNVTGDLYRVQNGAHYTVFLVTSEGIILADPINADFSNWLKTELAERFDATVRYIIYSHHHGDHASGADVFADSAAVIAHENTPPNLAARAGNAALADVRVPDTTYSDQTTVTLGGKTVELIHSVPSHSDDSTILLFPDERAVFAVDFVSVRGLPYRTLPGGPATAWIEATAHLQTLDYDLILPGHGSTGSKADVDAYKGYLEDLVAAVSEGIEAGRSLEELQESITLEEYQDWRSFHWRTENIQGTYEALMSQ